MRIAHVVTYISSDGAFGGPVRVAREQARALANLGHEVTVFAASGPDESGVRSEHGVIERTFSPGLRPSRGGFALTHSPQLREHLSKELGRFDIVHVHMGRDLVTLPAALKSRSMRIPYVVQPHGMVAKSRNPLARPLDLLVTKKVLHDAAAVLALTVQEERELRRVAANAKIHPFRNGISTATHTSARRDDNTVLFLARLHARKRPVAFVQMAARLKETHPEARFIIAGADEGEADAVASAIEQLGVSDTTSLIGAVSPDATDELLSRATVFVLPSVGEVFPMTLLEALRVRTPVVTTSSLGIADDCIRYNAAIVTDGTVQELAGAVDKLLSSRQHQKELVSGGTKYLNEQLSIDSVAMKLQEIYAMAIQ